MGPAWCSLYLLFWGGSFYICDDVAKKSAKLAVFTFFDGHIHWCAVADVKSQIFTDSAVHCNVLHFANYRSWRQASIFQARYTECFTCMSAFNTVVSSPLNRHTCSCACSGASVRAALAVRHVPISRAKPKIRTEKAILPLVFRYTLTLCTLR